MSFRIERDTMGEIRVESQNMWGAQTERSRKNFQIGLEKMPIEVIYAYALIKKSAAKVNGELGKFTRKKAEVMINACDQIIQGNLDEQFPLSVWQTGSGTQTNMNVNEVIAHICNKQLKKEKLSIRVHPNDDVNMGQSSNDTFPTAMHVAVVLMLKEELLPEIKRLIQTLEQKKEEYKAIIKIGRTHLQDATPLTVGQEISGWIHMLDVNEKMIKESMNHLRHLAIGGTAVGTGLNTHPLFGMKVCEEISRLTNETFKTSPNKFHALTSHDELVFAHGALKALAADLMKIANDIRWLASGPRCGIGEMKIPANEPGSSIMPGKVNPTQSEAVTMIAAQVMGNDATVGFAASQGNFQLNVFKPVIVYNVIQSIRLLADGMRSFHDHCIKGLQVNEEVTQHYVENSLMLVTALNPHIGYEKAAKIAKEAYEHGISLKEAANKLQLLTEEEFDQIVKLEQMIESRME